MCGGAEVQPIVTIFGTARDLAGLINRATFVVIGSRVSDLERVKFGGQA